MKLLISIEVIVAICKYLLKYTNLWRIYITFVVLKNEKDMKCRLQISSKYCCNENLDTSRWVDYFLLSSNVVMKFLIFMKDV